ncbi:putative quinol monooxygenase [Sphingobium estronivorans]|uniref:putative quinol monooxygenase n=1 Tax=Sphingobium estronivorans TaxID=1577690 RepID=UPI0013C2FAC6|nr:antibiotic biosynthesis monooxygenase [Sphingobium estronivorans]
MAIIRHYQMTAISGREDDLKSALVLLAQKVSAMDGCVELQIFQDPKATETFIFIERWRSLADHEASGKVLGREAFSNVMAALSTPLLARYLEPVCQVHPVG